MTQKPAEYERILGAFTADADVLILLDPSMAQAIERQELFVARRMLSAAERHFQTRGVPRPRAAALLNLGALEWSMGCGQCAYERVTEAQRIFAQLGDLEGLAHAYEWLGYFFEESREPELAADHLGLARALYRRLENESAAARVLAYGE